MSITFKDWDEALACLLSVDEEGCWSYVVRLDGGWTVIFGYGWTVGGCDEEL